MAPMPSAVSDHGPSDFRRLCSGCSASAISLSMDLQQRSWLPRASVGWAAWCVVGEGPKGPRCWCGADTLCPSRRLPFLLVRRTQRSAPHRNYLFACPRTIFFTLRFCDPRAYSRGFNGCSSLRFLRATRFDFLRSSLLRAVVLAMIAFQCPIFVPRQFFNVTCVAARGGPAGRSLRQLWSNPGLLQARAKSMYPCSTSVLVSFTWT